MPTLSFSTTTTKLFRQDISRKLLFLHNPLYRPPPHEQPSAAAAPVLSPVDRYNLDGNVVMVLSVLLCGVICSLGLHYILRCLFRCSSTLLSFDLSANDNNNPTSTTTTSTTTTTSASNKGGVKREALETFPIVCYSSEKSLTVGGLDTECVICIAEFSQGERLRVLPYCNHGFHVHCVDKWLESHSSCPKCRHCLIQTCEKIVGGCGTSREARVNIVALQHERMMSS